VPGSDEEWWDAAGIAPNRTGQSDVMVAVVSDSPPAELPSPELADAAQEYEEDEALMPPPSAGKTAHVRGRARRRPVWPFLVVGLLGLGAGAGTYSALVWHNSRSVRDAGALSRPDARAGGATARADAGLARTPARRDVRVVER
jgi:hypothetical protein